MMVVSGLMLISKIVRSSGACGCGGEGKSDMSVKVMSGVRIRLRALEAPIPMHPIYKDNYRRLNMIGRERANRALIGCDSQ